MKDERLDFVDPERENYAVSSLRPGKNPGFGEIFRFLFQDLEIWIRKHEKYMRLCW